MIFSSMKGEVKLMKISEHQKLKYVNNNNNNNFIASIAHDTWEDALVRFTMTKTIILLFTIKSVTWKMEKSKAN